MRPTTDLQRTVAPFEVVSDFQPAGDQPAAIAELARRIKAGEKDIVLLGATGTGKSATTAWVIEQVQRPTLVMAPNKTLAAQLANEFRELLPNNAVEYFVSYYDYYQPEAYVPQTDTYIEKDSSINDEVERLRHSATNSLLTRRDVIVVASVSCIYGLGTPQEYVDRMARLRVGMEIERDELLQRFVQMQYTRNDLAFTRGTFRVRGDTVEIIPVYEELADPHRVLRRRDRADLHAAPGHRRDRARGEGDVRLPGHALRRRTGADGARDPRHRARARRPARGVREAGQAARGAAAAHAHHLRRRDDAPGGVVLRHRELLAAHRRPGPRVSAQLPARLLPRGLPAGHRRVPRHRPADRGDVRGRHVAQAHPGRPRLPAAVRDGQPAAEVGGVPRAHRAGGLPVGHARALRAGQGQRGRRADHPPDRPGRPRGRPQADQGADRRPAARDQPARRAQRAGPGHHLDQEDGRGPHRLPPRQGRPGPLPPLRHRHAAARGAAA